MKESEQTQSRRLEVGLQDCISLALKREEWRAGRECCVDICITTFGEPEVTLSCIRSILAAKSEILYRIIVADDASGDTFFLRLSEIPGLKVIIQKQNLGYLNNCNSLVAQSSGDYFVLLNNDTQVCDFWIDSLLSTICARDDAGAVGAKLLNIDGSLQEAGCIVWSDGTAWNWGTGASHLRYDFNYVRPVDYCSAACLIVRREAWDRVGGFSPDYAPAYCEDSDLAFKFREIGFDTIYQPACEVIHHGGLTHGHDVSNGIKSFQLLNQEKLATRWRSVLAADHYPQGSNLQHAVYRARGVKWILVIEQGVPTPSRDAGSKTIDQIIRLLISWKFRVTLWPLNEKDETDTIQTYRQLGVEVVVNNHNHEPKSLSGFLADRAGSLTAVFISRPDTLKRAESTLSLFPSLQIMYYGHDIHWLRESSTASSRYLGRDRRISNLCWQTTRQLEVFACTKATVAIYPSIEEVGFLKDHLANRESEPSTAINVALGQPYWFEIDNTTEPECSNRVGAIFVGGWGHPPNVEAALWLTQSILPKVRCRHRAFTISLIGSNPSEAVKKLESDSVKVFENVSQDQLRTAYANARVVLVPLLSGGGVKLKVLEAFNYGVPVVTTSIGLQGIESLVRLSVAKSTGELAYASVADHSGKFAEAVCELLEDDALWKARSLASRKVLLSCYSHDKFASSWSRLFATVGAIPQDGLDVAG
jgi:GT2 family glycosyltransferase